MGMYPDKNGRIRIEVRNGDIVTTPADAIVCSASPSLSGTYGLEGAIHKAAGNELLRECRALETCACGDAKVTRGYNLKAKYIIHTVTPYYMPEEPEAEELLASCYRRCVERAVENGCESIAFPLISTGEKRFPPEIAARIAIRTIVSAAKEYVTDNFTVFLILHSAEYPLDERAFPYLDELHGLSLSDEQQYPPETFSLNNACSVLGAAAGDLAASGFYTVRNTNSISKLVSHGNVSDKTILTMAVADGILEGGEASHFIQAMKKMGKAVPWHGLWNTFFRVAEK